MVCVWCLFYPAGQKPRVCDLVTRVGAAFSVAGSIVG